MLPSLGPLRGKQARPRLLGSAPTFLLSGGLPPTEAVPAPHPGPSRHCSKSKNWRAKEVYLSV